MQRYVDTGLEPMEIAPFDMLEHLPNETWIHVAFIAERVQWFAR
jgi:hypothetical protein